MDIEMQDEVPWSNSLTPYDKEHFWIYMRFLDAADSASYEEMAQLILGIDPEREPTSGCTADFQPEPRRVRSRV
ncbi:hypothetical protein EOD23_03510 [Mesorhizobium sp. USDA-HM6]|nr:hypothetical protein EOD23_03510 [Mesorhizobium sp. USDA-HM6]